MKGKIERALVELITNSDDSYKDLEDEGQKISGKIRIEIERKQKPKPSLIIVRDRAKGMNAEEMKKNIGTLGRRTSGFETGKARRGLLGRGAKDVGSFGKVHFESVKDGEYSSLIIPNSLICKFESEKKVSQPIREKLGIPKGNGTIVTIEVESRFNIPQHESLIKNFSRYYSLRDIFSNPNRKVIIEDQNKKREDQLLYNYPNFGKVVFDDDITIPDYPDAKAHLIICQHESPFEEIHNSPYREGIVVKSNVAIHDCIYFGLESEPFAWRFSGQLYCSFIDKLVKDYDDREEKNPDTPNHSDDNPMRLLDPFRDGLVGEHPFTHKLYKKCKEILKFYVDELKAVEQPPKRNVTDENLDQKLNDLSKVLSKVFEKKLQELEEDIIPEDVNDAQIENLSIGLHIIPPGDKQPIPIVANQPKTFTVMVKHHETLDESLLVNVESSDPKDIIVIKSPITLKKYYKNKTIGTTTFTVKSSKVGAEALIEVRYSAYEKLSHVRVVKEPDANLDLPDGLSFEKPVYHLRINKDKTLNLRLKTEKEQKDNFIAQIVSDNPEIAVKNGGRCELRATPTKTVYIGKIKVQGRQLKLKGKLTAIIKGFKSAETRITVEERETLSGLKLKFRPIEDLFGAVRYKWDDKEPFLLLIGAKHPSVRKYLGELEGERYTGIDSPLYHTILAEIISEAIAFNILERQFKREGQDGMLDYASTDAYYHKHFSEFLMVAHKILVTENGGSILHA